ncbi:hypothetical protein [Arthrobacter sp. efr-133-R2A-63]|uniref:hypothetical protein n=1 Tax=Arthrobacter sp. efr-133-R2A-63 TaxID=3040278 RepID=UPI00254D1A1A|nr:hypothetical protein [Arthrobacter sp. efr-133-R2A-63]
MTTTTIDAADELVERFYSSGWMLSWESQQKSGPGGRREWPWLLADVISKFVAATAGQVIELADATVRDEKQVEFIVVTSEVVAFLSVDIENEIPHIAPSLRLIPRSSLREIKIVKGVNLGGPKWSHRESEGVVIEVDFGVEDIKTLPLNPDDVRQVRFEKEGTPPVHADLEKLLPGLLRDLNR